MKKMLLFFAIACLCFGGRSVHAYTQVLIDEIMYDVSGADTGHEWIEVYNSGSTSINFTKWKLFEGDSDQKNHGIKQYMGSDVLSSGAFAIIATNGDTFTADHPEYSGQLFTSSFSLSNNGETIGLKDSNDSISHQVSYAKGVGAAGDGNSLQKIDDTWQAAPPTIGVQNQARIEPQNKEEYTPIVNHNIDGSITIRGDRVMGETLTFVAEFDIDKPQGKVVWNFGDGFSVEKDVLGETEHAFAFSGTYTVVLADANGQIRAQMPVIIADKPALIEEVHTPRVEAPLPLSETIEKKLDDTTIITPEVPYVVPIAAAASARVHVSDWLVGFGVFAVCAIIGFRIYKKRQSLNMTTDNIELID